MGKARNLSEKIWTKEFIIIFFYHFIVMFSMYVSIVTIGNFAIENFNASASTAGLVASIFIVGVLAGRAISGYQVNRLGARKIMYIGTVLFFLTYGLYFIDGGLVLLIAARFLNGFATGLISTALNTLATISVPENRRGEGISYFSLSFVLGSAVGPFLGFLLLEIMSFNTMLILVLIAVFIVALMTPMVRLNNITRDYKPEAGKFRMIDRDALPMGFSVLFMGLAYASILSFLNLYAIEVNLVTAASFFFLVYSAVVMLTRPLTGKMMDQKGANIVLYPTFIFMAIGFYVLGNSTTGFIMLLAGALIGLGFGNFQSIAQTVCVNLADRDNVGLATSTYFIMLEVGLGFGPFFLGFLVPSLGYGGLYQSLVISILVGLVIFYFVYGRHESRNRRVENLE
ncbi:MFS transporter [Salinicoccus halodurans]|uniref:Multidrug MFS transporter n=1 Tax=Salinicoccus halodurans TaxID=407035 RepID=A0A0F7HPE2_9STAP|nr:MFS transporter [Salinicoccus halodurans]AKG75026.1 multidrug MFS transporter [Salinicoccus halodurans]SFK64789.1 Predicted arabinose efflux permease, MFS family [Salinicoccus halodurans]